MFLYKHGVKVDEGVGSMFCFKIFCFSSFTPAGCWRNRRDLVCLVEALFPQGVPLVPFLFFPCSPKPQIQNHSTLIHLGCHHHLSCPALPLYTDSLSLWFTLVLSLMETLVVLLTVLWWSSHIVSTTLNGACGTFWWQQRVVEINQYKYTDFFLFFCPQEGYLVLKIWEAEWCGE